MSPDEEDNGGSRQPDQLAEPREEGLPHGWVGHGPGRRGEPSPEEESNPTPEDPQETDSGHADGQHWTDTHPDRHLWSPGRMALARSQTQEEYEAHYGRGEPVEPKPHVRVNPGLTSISGSPSLRKPRPPRFFHQISEKLGFSPEGIEPRPPKMPPWKGDEGDCAPNFWNPETDGDGLDPDTIKGGFPPVEEEVAPSPDGDVTPSGAGDTRPHHCTPDSIAYYHPWHIGGDSHWGIYFRVRNMDSFIRRVERLFGYRNMRDLLTEQVYWHEMEHFEQEKAAFLLEDLLGEILYPDWLRERFDTPVFLENRSTGQYEEVYLIEEALATAREVEWAERRSNPTTIPAGYPTFVREDSLRAPRGYNRFYLCLGQYERAEARAAFIESVSRIATPRSPHRLSHKMVNSLFDSQRWKRDKVPVYHVID
jgi:hypothetical protein